MVKRKERIKKSSFHIKDGFDAEALKKVAKKARPITERYASELELQS